MDLPSSGGDMQSCKLDRRLAERAHIALVIQWIGWHGGTVAGDVDASYLSIAQNRDEHGRVSELGHSAFVLTGAQSAEGGREQSGSKLRPFDDEAKPVTCSGEVIADRSLGWPPPR